MWTLQTIYLFTMKDNKWHLLMIYNLIHNSLFVHFNVDAWPVEPWGDYAY
jgi:hypothetical protein